MDRGVFCPLDDLTTVPEDWIAVSNASARPFSWTKTADQITDRTCRSCSRIFSSTATPSVLPLGTEGANKSVALAAATAATARNGSTGLIALDYRAHRDAVESAYQGVPVRGIHQRHLTVT